MSEKRASYQSGSAAFELHLGSALKAILPGAFQGAVIGSLFVAMYFALDFILADGLSAFTDFLGLLMGLLVIVMFGTMAGMVMCLVYLALIGLPLAVVMRRRVGTRIGLVAALFVAVITATISAYLAIKDGWTSNIEDWIVGGVALAYAIPSGVAYRQAIIAERMLSFWSAPDD
ncbi:MAG: hypothetical protein AAF692_00105 [Pseudomonadota bacterium]